MKKGIAVLMLLLVAFSVMAQTKQKTKSAKENPSQAEMNKLLEEAMKAEGMSKEEQEEMRKMMGEIMPDLMEQNAGTADYPSFASNKELLPVKDIARIAIAKKKKITQGEIKAYADQLFSKLMAKGNTTEIAIAKKVIAQTPGAADINEAAILCMLQGHSEAALALAIKAVQTAPANSNYQNNMAALLTQYGFAELAIPVLNKLRTTEPSNSTLLNNLAYAWLSLGEADSAKLYSNGAIFVNPAHPEAPACGGLLIDSRGGDPIKEYTGALENAINPFTEKMVQNRNTNPRLDWNRIKRNLSIHEFIPKDWMQLPSPLSNDVKNFYVDQATKKAYLDMTEKFQEKIKLMTEELQKDLDKLADKGEDEFVKQMAKETMKGLSIISKPATTVLKVLLNYQLQAQTELADSLKTIINWQEKLKAEKDREIKKIYNQIDDSKGTTCKQFKTRLDELENVYMQRVNSRLRNVMTKNADNYREWLNAFATWNWFVAGNIKNQITIQNLESTAYLVELYANIVTQMETLPQHCGVKADDIVKTIPEPEIPNFSCPAVVHLPAGKEWQQLSNESKNFDKNKYGITKTDKPIPNVTVAYGTGNSIAQPGYTPFIKTADGSIAPGGMNNDDELAPLPNIEKEELAPIPHIPREELAPLPNLPKDDELMPIPDLKKSQLAKDLLKNMFAKSCEKKKTKKVKFVVTPDFSKLVMWDADTQIEHEDGFVVGIGELIMDPLPSKGNTPVGSNQLKINPTAGAHPKGAKLLQEAKTTLEGGLQSTINNGMQVPGATALNKNLFN